MAHIINPVNAPQSSDLYAAQPITFESMRQARKFASPSVDVRLLTTQFPEDSEALPEDFERTPDLTRSVLDLGVFKTPRKLPLLRDILERIDVASEGAEYLIYTNVDIGLQPEFYVAVNRVIEQGYDALVINRRTICGDTWATSDLPLIYATVGERHPGWDCFVFRRERCRDYDVGDVCIGAPFVGLAFISNLIAWSTRFREFRDLHLTFHLGRDADWKSARYNDYALHNDREAEAAITRLLDTTGKCPNRSSLEEFLRDVAVNRRDVRLLHRMFHIRPRRHFIARAVRSLCRRFEVP
jgi:hypothetical protein